MTVIDPKDRIFVALDTQDMGRAAALARDFAGAVGGVKIGKEFFTAHGPGGVRAVAGGVPLFLDLKFHDIPNTVAGALRAAAHLRPAMVNVHASGGRAMLEAAAQAVREGA
ncbi:MAG: orotidine 5'-phosphate decarboxylase / HUMPS family protein, partial [Kiloniellales bacterium]